MLLRISAIYGHGSGAEVASMKRPQQLAIGLTRFNIDSKKERE